ncbi:MAG: zf-TFIIB domain-containing protein [Candidatus Binatia bacterium]
MENEKHLLVESLKFDERANEDSYFAVKEHELIEEMKLEFHKAEAARRATQMATCPKCSGTFEKYEFRGLNLYRCGNCEGIWLNKGELGAILRRQARSPLGVLLDRCFSKSETAKKNQI